MRMEAMPGNGSRIVPRPIYAMGVGQLEGVGREILSFLGMLFVSRKWEGIEPRRGKCAKAHGIGKTEGPLPEIGT